MILCVCDCSTAIRAVETNVMMNALPNESCPSMYGSVQLFSFVLSIGVCVSFLPFFPLKTDIPQSYREVLFSVSCAIYGACMFIASFLALVFICCKSKFHRTHTILWPTSCRHCSRVLHSSSGISTGSEEEHAVTPGPTCGVATPRGSKRDPLTQPLISPHHGHSVGSLSPVASSGEDVNNSSGHMPFEPVPTSAHIDSCDPKILFHEISPSTRTVESTAGLRHEIVSSTSFNCASVPISRQCYKISVPAFQRHKSMLRLYQISSMVEFIGRISEILFLKIL